MDIEIKNLACFASIRIPANWVELSAPKDRGASWLRHFAPPGVKSVEIGIFHDGSLLSDTARGAFRTTMQAGERPIFDLDQAIENDHNLAAVLSAAIGNAGQNQLTMANTEWELFALQRMSIVDLGGRNALQVTGYFRDESGVAVNYYEAFNLDGTAAQDYCRVVQLYLQAPTQELFDTYRADFNKTLRSVKLEVSV